MIIRSLKWQIQAWHMALLAVIVASLLTVFYFYEKSMQLRLMELEMRDPVSILLPHFERGKTSQSRVPPEGRPHRRGNEGPRHRRRNRPNGPNDNAPANAHPSRNLQEITAHYLKKVESDDYYVVYWKQGSIHYQTENSPTAQPIPAGERRPNKLQGEKRYRWNGNYREFIQNTPYGSLVIGRSVNAIDADMATFRNKLIIVGLGVLTVGFLVSWFLTTRAIRPIQKMSDTANKIAHGDLSQRIDELNTRNELSELAHILNETFDQLDNSFEQQMRFTADASHEMRTPLAVIIAKSEFALARERSIEKYQDTIETCYESANHMSELIESLTALARVDSGEFEVVPVLGDIGGLASLSVSMLEPIAKQRNISIHSSIGMVEAHFDRPKMKQVIINLLSNAIKYNQDQGKVFVNVVDSPEQVSLQIRDTGPGIKEEHLPYIFDRFYRVDESRKTLEGSTGLGLAISKAIINAHSGTLTVESQYGNGTTFTLTLPKK